MRVEVGPGNAVEVLVGRPAERPRGTLVLFHGLSGSADAVYMRRTAREALARRWSVARVNLRTCGGTEALSRTLYNAGQWGDAGSVLRELDRHRLPRPFAALGFSLGGNLVVGHAGREGGACGADAVAAVNPPLDLAECIEALERPGNFPFQIYFSLALCAQVRRVRRVRPVAGPPARVWRVFGVRAFDQAFTAPDAGYPDAESYYRGASAGPLVRGIRVPALVLTSRNDPFVPVASVTRFLGSPGVEGAVTDRGGHVGFWHRGKPRFWAAGAVLGWLEARLGGAV